MPFVIVSLILWAVAFAVSQILAPKVNIENARRATLDEFKFPTATEGRCQPLLWGTARVKAPNVIWYGNLKCVEITTRVRTSMTNKKTQTVGWDYYMGVQMAVALGDLTLRAVYIGDDLAWSGSMSAVTDFTVAGGQASGNCTFYPGSSSQGIDTYLASAVSPDECPAYRGLSHIVFKDGYIGRDNTTPKPWSFEVTRIPNGLSLSTANSELNGGFDANPMNVIYEILTNAEWGYGYPTGDMNLTNFTAAATTLATEGNGFSLQMDRTRKAGDILDELQRQIDGSLKINKTTGQWEITLIRDGYSTTGLKVIDDSTALTIEDFSRGAWEGTTNYIRVQYNNRDNEYMDGYAPAQDMANMRIQNRRITGTLSFPGVKDSALANQLAWRELRSASYPLAKLRCTVGREFWDTYIGEVIQFSNAQHDIVDMPMRVADATIGNYEQGEIQLDLIQDVFSTHVPSFADPEPSSWAPPVWDLTALAADDQIAFEQPLAIKNRDEYPSAGKAWCMAVQTPLRADGFYVLQKNSAVIPPPGGTYYNSGTFPSWALPGTLDTAIDQDDTTIDILTDDMTAETFATITATEAGNDLVNIMMIGDEEFVVPLTATDITGGVRITTAYRGMLDSAQRAWGAGTKIWFMPQGGLTEVAFPLTNGVRIKYIPYYGSQKLSESDVGITEITFTMASRETRPYCPCNMNLNASQYPTTVSLEGNGSGLDGVGINVSWLRRDFRTYDEVAGVTTDAATLDPTFPAANTTQYAVEAVDDPDGTPASTYIGPWNGGAASQAVTRTKILAGNGGVLPTRMAMKVNTTHVVSTLSYTARYTLDHSFDVTSSLTGDHNFGVLGQNSWSNTWTAPDTGNYAFTLGTAGTVVTARINGGTETTIITGGSTTGTLTGVTTGDTIEVRHTGTLGVSESFLEVLSPVSAENAYAVFN